MAHVLSGTTPTTIPAGPHSRAHHVARPSEVVSKIKLGITDARFKLDAADRDLDEPRRLR
jgi:hypothetical protein